MLNDVNCRKISLQRFAVFIHSVNTLCTFREMQLDDGQFLVSAKRYDSLLKVSIGLK